VEAGYIFSGNVGSVILLKKNDDGSWSAPAAIGLGGVGWRWIAGAAMKDIIMVDSRTFPLLYCSPLHFGRTAISLSLPPKSQVPFGAAIDQQLEHTTPFQRLVEHVHSMTLCRSPAGQQFGIHSSSASEIDVS
jgi:hypothetical protein